MTGQLPESARGEGTAHVSALWLDEFGRLTGHVLHGLRNGLQGVGINLEVIRSRSEVGSATAADLRVFAANAARQFEDVSAQVEALAFLSKDVPGDAEIDATMRAIVTLLNAGGDTRVQLDGGAPQAKAAVSHIAARLIITHVIMSAAKTGSAVSCALVSARPVTAELRMTPAMTPVLDQEVLTVARALHIRIAANASAVTVTFPTTTSSDTVLV